MNLHVKQRLDFYAGGFLHAVCKPVALLLGMVLRRDHSLGRIRELTFIKMLGGGSLIIAYPALLALKRHPQIQKMRLVTTPAVKPFGEILGLFDEIIVIRDDSAVQLAATALAAMRKVFHCDATVDLEIHSRLTTVFSLLTCAVNRIGFYTGISFWRQNLCSYLLYCNLSNGIYDFYDQLARLFGAAVPDYETTSVEFRARLGLGERPQPGGTVRLGVAPCCSGLSKERMLTQEEWTTILLRKIASCPAGKTVELHLLGGASEAPYLETLKKMLLRNNLELHIENHAGKAKLADSVRILWQMDQILCIDSALLHFSRLLGVPTVSYWGPTDPRVLQRPTVEGRDEVHYAKLPCSPCVHLTETPPCCGNNLCMRFAADPNHPGDRNPMWVAN